MQTSSSSRRLELVYIKLLESPQHAVRVISVCSLNSSCCPGLRAEAIRIRRNYQQLLSRF